MKGCADFLLQIDNDPVNEDGEDDYSNWFTRFWRFGNIADLAIDFHDDYNNGIVQTSNSMRNWFQNYTQIDGIKQAG